MKYDRAVLQSDPRAQLIRRLFTAAAILVTVVLVGSSGYYFLGAGRWVWIECFYMTVITLSTVGFGETLVGMREVLYARVWTLVLIVLGSGTLLYFVSTFTAFLVEGEIQEAIRRNRMQKRIDALRDHIIVVGVGATGIHVVKELVATKTPFVVIDTSRERIAKVMEDEGVPDLLYVLGDATDDHVLEQAGIARAKGLAATLGADKDNVFVSITARALNPDLRIVSKVTEDSAAAKLTRAGANAIVSPSRIGGMRVTSELVRPRVVQFLDQMLYDRSRHLRIEEITIPASSSLCGAALQNTNIRQQTDVLVLAARYPDGKFRYNPGPEFALQKDMTLVVLAETDNVIRLRQGIERGSIGRV